MLSEQAQTRLVLVIWGCFMVGAMGWQSWIFGIIVLAAGVALVLLGLRWFKQYSSDVDAQRRDREIEEQELIERMARQHRQASSGDPRGVYGEGYDALRRYQRLSYPRMPEDD